MYDILAAHTLVIQKLGHLIRKSKLPKIKLKNLRLSDCGFLIFKYNFKTKHVKQKLN